MHRLVLTVVFLLLAHCFGVLSSTNKGNCPEGCACSWPDFKCLGCRNGYRRTEDDGSCRNEDRSTYQKHQQEVQQQDGPAALSILAVSEGDSVPVGERHFARLDPNLDPRLLFYVLIDPPKLGSLLLSAKVLQIGDAITRDDLIGERMVYRSDKEVGRVSVQDHIKWNLTSSPKRETPDDKTSKDVLVNGRVLDSSGNVLRRTEDTIKRARDEKDNNQAKTPSRSVVSTETLSITIEPKDDKAPQVAVHSELSVEEGGSEILAPDIISVSDSDSRSDGLTVELVSGPKHGYLEVRDRTGQKKVVTEFPLSALLEEQLSYIQNEHEGSEPRRDSFLLVVRDPSGNRSPPAQLDILIENVNDEKPQILVRPLVFAPGQTRITLTAEHLDIHDPDTELDEILISLSAEPSKGRLLKDDPLTLSDRVLRVGEAFDYQELLDGDISFTSSADNDVIHLQITDGLSAENVTLRFTTKPVKEQQYGRSDSTSTCIMEFNTTELIARENRGQIDVPVIRTGDLSTTCSVVCYTEAQSASDNSDFKGRPLTESSRLFFLRGVTVVQCSIPIFDDDTNEGEELLQVKLAKAQVERLNSQAFESNTSAMVGPGSQLSVRISDDEDVTRVYFNQSVYRPTAEADSFTLHIERSGDIRSASEVLVNTQDGSAKEGRDYKLKSRQLNLSPGERSGTIELVFLNKNTWSRSFQVQLQLTEQQSQTRLGLKSSATVLIPPAKTSGPALLPAEPIVVSLMDYDRIGSRENVTTVPAGYPVICVTPCDSKHPLYNTSMQRLCRNMAIDESKIRYSWEISPPRARNEPTTDDIFHRLTEPAAFSGVDGRVLDSVFFTSGFRIRCLAQPVKASESTSSSVVVGPASRSRPVTVSGVLGLCPPFTPLAQDDSSSVNGQQPFSASLSYVNSSDPLHPDTMRIQVHIPHADGQIPLISTQPLHGIRHIMSEPIYRLQHRCSNLQPATGFLNEMEGLNRTASLPYEFSKSLRQESAVRLYKHLDSHGCLWHFEAWYTMTELAQICNGQVTSNFQSMNRSQVQVTVRVPLYVTLVSVSAGGLGWTSIEHQTEMEFSFSYAPVLLGQRGVAESKLALAVQPHVTRIRTDPNNGRLVLDLQTETRFTGKYLESMAQLISPPHLPQLGFVVEMTWSQSQASGAYSQKWRAVSNYTLQDYTGNYTLILIPCTSDSKLTRSQDECVPGEPVNVSLPIHYQQPFRPEPVHYSLETTFQLTNDVRAFLRKPRSLDDIKDAEFEGSFHNGERVYGRVLWHPSNELSPGYRLWIEKLYLCAGRDGYVPLFEPNAELPQFGCLENSQRLKYRLLLLDREDPYRSDKAVQGLSLDAKFASQVEVLRTGMAHLPSMDGFVFSVDPLFKLEPGTRWFLQVSYSVQPVGGTSRWKRQQGTYKSDEGSYGTLTTLETRRGTNIRFLPLDWPPDQMDSKSEFPAFTSTLLLTVVLLVILVMAVMIVFSIYCRTIKHQQKKNRKKRIELSDQPDDDESEPMKAINNNGRTIARLGYAKTTLV